MPTQKCGPREGPGDCSVESSSTAVPSWALLFRETKKTTQPPLTLELMRPHFQHFSEQISLYAHSFHVRYGAEDERGKFPDSLTTEMILETRAALRFAVLCLVRAQTRSQMQREAILTYRWHQVLCQSLSRKKGDSKCRVLAARLLSNLVTCNYETAGVVASDVGLSPSHEMVKSRIRTTLTRFTHEKSDGNDCEGPTWVDMILACAQSGCREGLAATTAALHNCICSIYSKECGPDRSYAEKVASDDLLISTLLRQILPANSVTSLANGDENSHFDSASEWIFLTIEKLCRLGLLSEMYSSAGGQSDLNTSKTGCVTAEHIVLLHCAARGVEGATQPTGHGQQLFLGEEAGSDAILSSCIFLAEKLSSLRGVLTNSTAERPTIDYECQDLTKSAWFLFLEMLASLLGVGEQPVINQARRLLGRVTSVIQDVALDLGSVLDFLSAKNHGRKARELSLSEDEQKSIVGLVRLIGNVCFRCRQNQDLIRQTIVPLPADASGLNNTLHQRTALHVLLSCTSFSYGCFTLREWAVVALRNVLEGNEANQELVDKLEAQAPLQSAELEKMNLRVDMNRQGEVRVVPLNKPTNAPKEEA